MIRFKSLAQNLNERDLLKLYRLEKDNMTKRNIKQAKKIMLYISELLMLGRSKNIRVLVSTQRPDATAFPSGSRLNFGIVLVLGAYLSSTYEMLMPEYMNLVKERRFQTGEGSILLQGSQLQFIKIPMIYDWDKIQKICKKGLM